MGTVQIAEVQDIQGTAYAVNADGGRRLLEAGDALFDGESVESAEGSVVELTLSDGQSLVIAGQPVFLISADLIADLAPGADESALQTETLDELLVEGSLESLEQIINSAEDAEAERLDDLLAAAEEDPTASGIDFDNLAATAAGGDDSGAGGGGSTIVQATRITSSGDATSATLTEGNTQAAASADIAGGTNNSLSVAVDDAFAISEDTPSAGNLADNDALAGDVTFALLDQAGPSNGAVTLNEDGTFVFTPSTDFVGEDSFQYVITDANGQTSTATVSITVEAVNDAPVALDDVVTAQEDVLLENINVLDNDTDSDGNPLTVTNAVSAAGGVVTINADGTLSYQAPANFTGPDTINYTIDDGAGGTSTAVVNIDVAPVADLAAADDFNTGDEDTVISGSVADNDTTLSGGALTYAVESTVEKGALIFNADGSYEYTPNPNFNGADRFTYVVTDADSGESLTQSVTLTVDAISDLTAAVDQNTGDQDTVISGSVADNDATSSGGTLTYVIESGVKSGTLTLNADGAYNYTPSVGFNGTDSFSYIVTDSGSGERVTQTVTITVNAVTEAPVDETPIDEAPDDETPVDVNQAPIAQNDRAEVVQNVPLRSIKVLDNDEDPEGGTLTLTAAEAASGALVSINADGTLNYTPNVDFLGADSVTYTITDAEGATAQASLVVVISEPQAQNALEGEPLDVYLKDTASLRSLPAGTTVTVASSQGSLVSISEDGVMSYQAPPGFTGEDVITYTTDDGQGNVVTKTVVMQVYPQDAALVGIDDAVVTQEDASVLNIAVLANDKIAEGSDVAVIAASSSLGGQVEINADGTLNYAPLQDFTGIDTVTYTARNGDGIESTATLSLEVTPENDPPVAVVDAVTTLEDTPLENINVLGTDIDVDGDTLTVLEVSSAIGAEVTLNDDGTVNYQPNANFNGVDTITYSVSDGLGGVTTGELKISVEAVNDAPVVTGEQVSAVQNEAIDAIAVLLNDEDPDGNSLTVEAAVASSGGTVEINEDGTLKYTPAPDFVGEETLTYTVIDGQGGRVEGQVTVSVASLGDGPLAKDDSASVDEDALLKNINVLGNDTDANNDALTVTAAVSTAGAAVTINADGTLNYLPLANFTGEDTITYTISDGNGGASTATVTVTVESVNDTPVAVASNEGTSEETVLNGAVPAATDIDGTILSYALVNNVAEGGLTLNVDGSYRFDPGSDFEDLAEGESRDVTFTYTATDNEDQVSAPATVTITVTGTGDAPVASAATQVTNENTVLEATVAATSVDSVVASYAVATDLADQGQGSLTFNEDGSYRFAPGSDFDDLADGESREVAFTYTATDENGGVSAPATVTITVTGTNDTPVATNASVETLEDTSIIELDVLGNVIDIDGDALTLVSVESEAGGTITLNEGGTINYGPAENYFGSDTLTYVATDPTGESVTGSIVIDIIAVNDAPVVVGETIITDEDAAVNNIVVLSNDSDIEGDALSVTEASSVNGGTVTINEDGTLNYTPPVNFNGTDTIEYTVTDAGSAASVGAVLVTVNPIDDQPIASTLDAATDKGVAIEGDLSQRVESGDGSMTYALTLGAEPQHGVVTVNEDGTFIYTPDADFSGRERFGYTVTDEDGDQSSSVVTIQVVTDSFSANSPSDLPNDVPLAAADNYQVDEDTPITARVTINDDLSTDGDGANVVTVAEGDRPTHGALTMSEAGVFVYTPDTNYFGPDSFTYTLTDANGDTSSAVVTLNVGQVNDEAVFEGDVSGNMLEDGGLDRPLGEGAEVTPIIGALSATDFLGGTLEDTGLPGIDNLGTENGFRIAVDDQYAQAQDGVATIDGDGNWAYTPNANFNGPDSFTVLVTDDLGNVESQVINVTVDAQVDLSAADDAISVDEDGVLEASVADNDSTISGGLLTYALAAGATVGNGELLFNEDGSYTYTPNTDYYGPDSFSYVVTDAASGERSTQAVSITVNPVVEANLITIDAIEGDSGVAGDFQTNDTTLTVSGSLEKAIASDERVEISTDGGETWTTITVDGTNWSFEDPTAQTASFTYEVRIAGPGDSVGATAEQTVTMDTTPPVATIQLDDAITSDNIINAQESGEAITISGSVGGDVRAGDIVTLTVNGVQSQAAVESIEGALRFSVNISGADLVADDDLTIDAAITTTDDAGNVSALAADVQTYVVDLEAFATITVEVLPELEGVALENAIAVAAYRGDDLNVTGVAGLDAADAGEITLTVNGKTYTGEVGEQGTYSIAIAAADLVDAESAEGTTRAITVTVEASDEAGNPATASAATDVLVRPVQQVQFTDNYVDGVSYATTSGLSGTTGTNESTGEAGAQGAFLYRAGDTITLTLGSVIIAEFSADQVQGDVLFLQDIAGVALSDVNNEYVENMAIFLQAFDADANPDNGIQITPETAAFFEGYTDAGTGEALNLATAGKQMLANAFAAVAEATDADGNNLNLLPEGFDFTAQSETDSDGANADGLLENVMETGALEHVADTIVALAGDRTPDAFDARTADEITVAGGQITYNYSEANGTLTFTRDDLLKNALGEQAEGQQVTYDNLRIENIKLADGFEAVKAEGSEITYDAATETYTITLAEGVDQYDLEGLLINYRAYDWTAYVDTQATTLDLFNSHLSAEATTVNEGDAYAQFTLNSSLAFEADKTLNLEVTSASLGVDLAQMDDDFTAPIEYSTDGGDTWQIMPQGGVVYNELGEANPVFNFVLPAGATAIEVRIAIFDDLEVENTESIELFVNGDGFYNEDLSVVIEDNDVEKEAMLPEVSIEPGYVTENQGEAIFVVTLSEASESTVTVKFDTESLGAAVEGTDFTAVSGTVTFAPGETTATITVPIVDDELAQDELSPEFVVVNLSDPVGAALGDSQATLGIFDDEAGSATFDVEITLDAITEDNTVNAAEAEQTITVTGQVSKEVAGPAFVTLEVGGESYEVLVNSDGTFAVDIPGSVLAADSDGQTSYDSMITASVRAFGAVADEQGNIVNGQGVTTIGHDYSVDPSADEDAGTVSGSDTTTFTVTVDEGFEVTNATESEGVRVTLAGIDADAASVVVTFTDGATITDSIAASKDPVTGVWTVAAASLTGGQLSLADGEVGITAVVTDAAGNTSTATDTLVLDVTTPTISASNLSFDENTGSTETVVATFAADELNGDVSFSITSGNEDAYFALDGASGEVTLTQKGLDALNDDALVDSVYSLVVVGEDAAGNAAEATATVNFTAVNDAPTTSEVTLTAIAEDSGVRVITAAELLGNASDDESDTLTVSNLTASSGTLTDNLDGTWDFTPASNDDTNVSFAYTITDDGTTDGSPDPLSITTGSASLDITAVNDAPTTSEVTLTAIAEDSGVRVITAAELLGNASDDESDTLTVSNLTASSGTLTDNLDGTWDFTPASNDDTNVSFAYTITDDGTTDGSPDPLSITTGSASLDITAVNDAPTTSEVTLTAIAEDSGVRVITAAELLGNASDDESDTLTVSNLTASSGTLTDNLDGTWDFTPASNDDTNVSFAYTITDDGTTDGSPDPLSITTGSASLDITAVNDAPTTSEVTLTAIAEDSGVRVITAAELLGNASDDESDTLTVSNLTASSGTLTDNLDGTWDFTPASNDDTNVSFAYTITDDGTTDGSPDPLSITTGSASLDITAVNDAPTTSEVTLTAIAEDSGVRVITAAELLGNASDDESDTLTVSNLTASSGTLTDNLDGTWDFTPASNDDTNVSFAYTITDDGTTDGSPDPLSITTGSASLDITAVNDAPTTSEVTLTAIAEDSGVRVITAAELLGNASDDESDTLTVSNLTASSGTLTDNLDGTWDFTPASNDDTNVSFAYTITDDGTTDGSPDPLSITTGSASLDITAVNDAPTTSEVTLTAIAEDSGVRVITAAELLGNASDDESDTLTVSNLTASSGTLTDNLDGTWDFTPASNDDTNVSFAYTITDDGTTDGSPDPLSITTGSASLDITAVNDAPTTSEVTLTAIAEDSGVRVITAAELLGNASDDESDTLTVSNLTASSGTLTDNLDGTWDFTPASNDDTNVSFAYTITDDGTTDGSPDPLSITTGSASLDITAVNDAPTTSEVTLTAIAEDSGVRVITAAELLGNASDDESDTLTVSNLTASSGTLTDNLDGTWDFTPASNDDTNVSFAYTITDDGTTDGSPDPLSITTGSASLDITAVNDAPTTSEVTLTAIAEDSGVRVITAAELLGNASDDESDTLTVSNLTASSGTLTDNLDGTWDFTPASNDDTNVSFAYTITDDGTTDGSPDPLSITTGSASLDITAVNDAPTTSEVTLTAIAEDSGVRVITAAELLGNASDDESDTLTVSNLTASSGTLTDNLDGTWDFTPASNDDTNVSFAYTITDDGTTDGSPDPLSITTGSASLDITAVNDAPTTSEVTLTAIAEDSGVRVITAAELLGNASDDESDTLTVSNLTASSGTLTDNLDGTWDFTPASNDDTNVSFAYTITDDGTTDGSPDPLSITTGSASLDITAVNDAPTTSEVTLTAIAEDSGVRVITAAELLGNASDDESDTLTVSNLTASSGTLTDNLDGTWDFTPASNDDTNVSFAYTITDDGTTDGSPDPLSITTGSASLDITAVNDAPTTSEVTLTAIAEDSGVRVITAAELLGNASDDESDTLTVSNLTASSGTLTDNLDGTWDFTPASNDDTNVSFAYTITDDGTTDGSPDPLSITTGSASLDITAVNDAPTTSEVTLTAIAEDSGVRVITAAELLGNASDDESDTLTVSNLTASSGTLTDNLDGTWDFTPASNDDTNVSFAYTITDDGTTDGSPDPLSITTGSASLDITAVNDAPVAVDDSVTTARDTVFTSSVDLDANDTDLDGDNLSVTAGTYPTTQGGSLVLANDGSYTYTPATNFTGTDTFNYTVTDGTAADTGTLTITVSGAGLNIQSINGNISGSVFSTTVASGPKGALTTDFNDSIIAVANNNNFRGDSSIDTAGGDDSVNIGGDILSGNINMGSGKDTLTIGGTISQSVANSSIVGGSEDDTLVLGSYASSQWQNQDATVTGIGGKISGFETVVFTDGTYKINEDNTLGDPMPAPIAIDLDGDGIEYLGLDAGVTFAPGSDEAIRTAWVAAGDALLVFDANNSGTVDASREYVFTEWAEAATSDMAALREVFDTNHDDVLDASDDNWDQFKVWQDANSDGVTDEGELKSLDEAGITSIALTYNETSESSSEAGGDVLVAGQSDVTWSDGRVTQAEDTAFAIAAADDAPAIESEPSDAANSAGLLLGSDDDANLAWALADEVGAADDASIFAVQSDEGEAISLADLLGDVAQDDLADYISVESDGLNTVVSINPDGLGSDTAQQQSLTIEGVDLTTDTNGNALDIDSMNELLRNLYNGANDTGLM